MADTNSTGGRELPPRLHFKSGRYYYVKRGPKTVVWTGLSRNLSEALEQHRLLDAGKAIEAFEEYGAPSHWLGGHGNQVAPPSEATRPRFGHPLHADS